MTYFIIFAVLLLIVFFLITKKKKAPLQEKSFEEKYGKLHCDGCKCSVRNKCSEPERMFCRDVIMKVLPHGTFSGQHTVYLPSGNRRIDFAFGMSGHKFVHPSGGIKIAIELDGYGPHAKDITREQFDAQLKRQNELVLDGWHVLRFSFDQCRNGSAYCIACINKILKVNAELEPVALKRQN